MKVKVGSGFAVATGSAANQVIARAAALAISQPAADTPALAKEPR